MPSDNHIRASYFSVIMYVIIASIKGCTICCWHWRWNWDCFFTLGMRSGLRFVPLLACRNVLSSNPSVDAYSTNLLSRKIRSLVIFSKKALVPDKIGLNWENQNWLISSSVSASKKMHMLKNKCVVIAYSNHSFWYYLNLSRKLWKCSVSFEML